MNSYFKAGDLVRYVGRYTTTSFTIGKIYTVGGKYHQSQFADIGVIEDDRGGPNGWDYAMFELISDANPQPGYKIDIGAYPLPQMGPVMPAHACPAHTALYDSGWSRYLYCTICDSHGKLTKFTE